MIKFGLSTFQKNENYLKYLKDFHKILSLDLFYALPKVKSRTFIWGLEGSDLL